MLLLINQIACRSKGNVKCARLAANNKYKNIFIFLFLGNSSVLPIFIVKCRIKVSWKFIYGESNKFFALALLAVLVSDFRKAVVEQNLLTYEVIQ